MINNIVYLDLFSGIGGFAKGFEQAGLNITKHYYSEIDKHAMAVYKYNFKNAEYVGDVRVVSKRTITERPNIVTFGFPCQDLSVAGKGEGLSGARSGLFYEAIRIIKEFRPEVFIFENVKGLLSSNKGKDFEEVLRTIANLGLYECEWQLLNTAWVLPQNRERIYFVGHLRGASRPEVFPFTKADFGTTERQSETSIVRAITGGGNSGGHHSGMTLVKQQDRVYSPKGLMACLSKSRLDDKCKIEVENFQGKNIANTLRSGGSTTLSDKHNFDCIQIKPVLTPDRAEKRQNGRRFKEDGEPAFTLNTQDMHGVMISKNGSGEAAEYTEKEICPTLTCGGIGKNGDTQPFYKKETLIRRLTEIECERLQGFPDNWTLYGDYNGVIKKVAKTQRYKQLGNAVTTDMPRIIAERLSVFH